MRSFPDYQTFWVRIATSNYLNQFLTWIQIFDEQPAPGNAPGAPSSGSGYNAIVTVQSTAKVSVDLDDPGVPPPGTVRDGYDGNLNRPRPRFMDEYFESVFAYFQIRFLLIMMHPRNYTVIFIIDDSGSVSISLSFPYPWINSAHILYL